jgi:hypothetical protein
MTASRNGAPQPTLHLTRDERGHLIFTDGQGQRHEDVEAVRAFPITDPEHGVSILTREGKELAWIEDLTTLPTSLRRLLEEALDHKQFMPVIERIVGISRTAEPNEWGVVTDRGPTRFPLKSDEDVRRIAGQRALIVDAHGMRYLIPDLAVLDATSRRLLERYL